MAKLLGGARIHQGKVVGWAKEGSGDARIWVEAVVICRK